MSHIFATRRHLVRLLALPAVGAGLSLASNAESNPLFTAVSERGHFEVSAAPQDQLLPIGTLHTWTVQLLDVSGRPLGNAALAVGGGMAAHGHGLPTRPVVTPTDRVGEFRVEGIKFNMAGSWTLRFGIEHGTTRDIAEITFDVDF